MMNRRNFFKSLAGMGIALSYPPAFAGMEGKQPESQGSEYKKRMDAYGLIMFIHNGVEKWEQIKKDFSENEELCSFCESAMPVVMFDHYQLDVKLAANLYIKSKYIDPANRITEELKLKTEEFRLKMISYFENDIRELSLEIRFLLTKIEFIQEIKMHPAIKDLNLQSPASIRVVIDYLKIA